MGLTTACVFILPSSEKISCSYSHLLLWLVSALSLKVKTVDIDFISVGDVAVHVCAALSMESSEDTMGSGDPTDII